MIVLASALAAARSLLPRFDWYVVTNSGTGLVSIEIGTEGVFLFITPLQLALLWPWTEA